MERREWMHTQSRMMDLRELSSSTAQLSSWALKVSLKTSCFEQSDRSYKFSGEQQSRSISPITQPAKRYHIKGAFTAQQLSLAEHSHPVKTLRERYQHLKGLPLHNLEAVCPVLLIGSDNPHLITPVEPVRLGPPGGPAAIKTRLGWTLQGPVQHLRKDMTEQHCLFTSVLFPESDLYKQVEKLWQMEVLPWRNEKNCIGSRLDQEAVELLERKTVRVEVDGVK